MFVSQYDVSVALLSDRKLNFDSIPKVKHSIYINYLVST